MITGLLSVIIPTYKRSAKVLKGSVESVLAQDYPEIEILVIDDNIENNDFSHEIKEFCSKFNNVIYIKQDGNQGACAARNLGIVLSNGEYIGFLDDDDTWEQTKAKKQINMFKDNIGMVYCKGYLIDKNYAPPRESEYFNARMFKDNVTYQDLIAMDCIGSTSQVIIHKKCFIKCGGFDEALLARQDYEMWIRISRYYDIVGVDEYLFKHYIHKGEQISKNSKKALQGYKRVYSLYKKDFNKNRVGKKNMLKNIISSAKAAKDYRCLFNYSSKMMLSNPIWFLKKAVKESKKK
jgi:glycosyltransferase involved in cell wall biosynthesis